MAERSKIDYLTIEGFKSIKRLERFPLRELNVLIGTNGSGKSNFISFFQMLREMIAGRLQVWTRKQGSADRILSFGVKATDAIESMIEAGEVSYGFRLEATATEGLFYAKEELKSGSPSYVSGNSIKKGQVESMLSMRLGFPGVDGTIDFFSQTLSGMIAYHVHDTTDTAGVKRPGAVHDNEHLRPDASNLAAFLLAMQTRDACAYQLIRKTIQLAIPFFDDFDLRPQAIAGGEEQVTLLWKQRDSDYPFWPSQLSDGSIRFICLVTALLQPKSPVTMIIDEPELGLHPHALTILAGLLRSASKRMQVIVATQSVPLVNEFSVEDLIVVERENGESVFRRHNEADFELWLEEYTLGDLWEKNLLGGRLPG